MPEMQDWFFSEMWRAIASGELSFTDASQKASARYLKIPGNAQKLGLVYGEILSTTSPGAQFSKAMVPYLLGYLVAKAHLFPEEPQTRIETGLELAEHHLPYIALALVAAATLASHGHFLPVAEATLVTLAEVLHIFKGFLKRFRKYS